MGDNVDLQGAENKSPTDDQADETKEIFAKKISDTITSGFVTLSLAIGRRTGLFDELARQQEPRTAHEIAAAAGLKERYVREWLGSMVTSRIVEVDTTLDIPRYFVPPHRAAVLSPSGAEILRMAFSERVVHLAKVMDDMVECFKDDGPPGLPSSAYPDFQGWLQKVKGPMLDSTFIDNFLPTIPGLIEKLESGITVCDLGCASGYLLFLMARSFPNSTYYGIDLSAEAVSMAKKEAAARGITNVICDVGDATKLPDDWSEKFDYVITLSTIHDVNAPERCLREIRRVLKPGGQFSMWERDAHTQHHDNIGNPTASMIYVISMMSCVPMSLHDNGAGLGAMWGHEQALPMLERAGFSDVKKLGIPGNQGVAHYLCSKSGE
ncbi:uncharacterized protein LOC118418330 [Branchiostoma floridae]|uniref:Uncharacterized protein LOC118418330 n=1 Tax=Branchiostoma floridae TaxID=7739 RepID=A0A9J7LC18_BRAFL|nr:uncharacterized protein LOC118418330 [Branchiostoma floridae]